MENLMTISKEANNYRKNGEYAKAIQLYKSLWECSKDIYSGTGYLNCLRKTNQIESAIKLADELMDYNPTIDWTRNEILWLYISNVFKNDSSNTSIQNVKSIASKLLDLKPDKVQNESIIFWVLKLSSRYKDWKTMNEWIDKIDHNDLNREPIIVKGKEGWSRKALWYHYKIKGIIYAENFDRYTFNKLMDEALLGFPKQKIFFIRLKAISHSRQGEYGQAEKLYKELCNRNYVEWWIIYDYALLKIEIGEKKEGLSLMYKSINGRGTLDSKVKVIKDISNLCELFGQFENAYLNYILYKYIRERNQWKVEKEIDDKIVQLRESYGFEIELDYRKVHQRCVEIWKNEDTCGKNIPIDEHNKYIGYVVLGKTEQSYCFIKVKNMDSIFCMKSDLPNEVKDGSKVTFETTPSYDKKKGIDSVRATNIRVI